MAKRQAQEAQVLSQVLMAPVVAFATGLKDPNRARTLEKADMNKLLEMSFESAKAVPRVHKAERLAHGVKVVDTDPVSNPGSTQRGRVASDGISARAQETAARSKLRKCHAA
jgi:hypothetical protein